MKNFLLPHEKESVKALIKIREGETKLGQRIAHHWQDSEVQFVLLGIEEDIGVRFNRGIAGTKDAWSSFLHSFLNIQSTNLLTGEEVGIYGHLNFDPIKDSVRPDTVEIVDHEVSEVVFQIIEAGKIPVIIGGGHNNAYPIMKGFFDSKKQAIHSINLDAHSDFRIKEGRHSGNGFRYAYDRGYLKKYAIIGLHENYNSQLILDEISQNEDIWFCFWEDIFLRENLQFKEAILKAVDFTKGPFIGLELDLDSVEHVLASAMTPSGMTITQARQYIHQVTIKTEVAYLHICEGAAKLITGQQDSTIGKLISYLVSDFMKAFKSKRKN